MGTIELVDIDHDIKELKERDSLIDPLYAEIDSLQAQLDEATKERVCRWTKDPDGYYRSGCKVCNNRVTTTFCQYCGGKVEVV